MAMLPTSTLSIPFAQLLIFLRLLLLAWSRLGSVSWEIRDLTSTVPTPTQWLTRSFVNSFPVYLTGYVTQSRMMQRPPHGWSAWNLLIHASPLSYFPMIRPFLLVSTLGPHVSLPRGRLVTLIESFTWVSWSILSICCAILIHRFISVTWEPVPKQVLQEWRPTVIGSTSKSADSDAEDSSPDNTDSDSPGFPPLSQRRHLRSEDEVADDIICVSGKKLTYMPI